MWKKIVLSIVSLTICFQLLSQTEAGAPKLSDPKSFTWILLPDPQSYNKFGRNQALFQLMTSWIADQKEALNIQLVLCVGDLVEQNNLLLPDGKNGDQTSVEQWEAVQTAFSKLNDQVPYILCTGNHDYGIKSAENRYSQFNSYFPPQGNPLTRELLVEMAPNAAAVQTLENACYEWKSPFGQPFLIFSLEFAPRTAILQWAKQVASRPEYKDHLGVLLTHSYQNSKKELTGKEHYPLTDANYGAAIWKDFINPSGNMRFVFCGHIADSESHEGMVSYREDTNQTGKKVHQMLFNAQREGGGWHGNGGDGWLRILEFLPDQKTIKVHTFSPLFWISPSTRHLAWRTESFDQYDITYE
ncbi:MAG: metallophosphoesterase [Mangrovibacterium sp.]|nr:metallophosphoesterase [Mangrovibacterium sp.]